MAIDPRGSDLKRLLAEDPGGPVVMLNLLRFNDDPGRASYERYAREIVPFLDARGAAVLYLGDCSTSLVAAQDEWDAVLLVRYPTRAAFSDMVADPEYQRITPLRSAALDAAVLQATIPWPSSPGA